ncbi:MAG: hypothetical protein PVF43_02065, partial [Candidatus Eiseniibacteriota bacterium]
MPVPRLLGHPGYSLLVTAAGTGRSVAAVGEQAPVALNVWHPDRVEDPHGCFVYLRDRDSGAVWSAGHQPTRQVAERYEVDWEPGVYRIRRLDRNIETTLEICVVSQAAIELRRLTLRNAASVRRRIEVTSLVELALADAAAHAAHPVFSKLFVQTEHVAGSGILLARRRPRAANERHPWLVHALCVARGGVNGNPRIAHETDRAAFIGRGRDRAAPAALVGDTPLGGTTGNVLDPIFSLRGELELPPGGEGQVTLLLGAAADRPAALDVAARWADGAAIEPAFAAARRDAARTLTDLGIDRSEAATLSGLGAAMLYGPDGRWRPAASAPPRDVPAPDDVDREALADLGLDPGRPLALLRPPASCPDPGPLATAFARAARYWQTLGHAVDMLCIAGDAATHRAMTAAIERAGGGVRLAVLDAEQLAAPVSARLEQIAHLVVRDRMPGRTDVDGGGGPDEHLPWLTPPARTPALPRRTVVPQAVGERDAGSGDAPETLRFDNGHGGFTTDGAEYVIRLPRGADGVLRLPPRPWVNVIANEQCGCLVSETGAGTTWSANSREFRLTPWSNDPVLDPHGEAFYVRDEESGAFWSLLPGPAPGATGYTMRHGLGYSRCDAAGAGLEHRTTIAVAEREPLRITHIRLTHTGDRRRRLALFAYYHLVLGALPERTASSVIVRPGARAPVVLARNPLAGPYAGLTAAAGIALPPGIGDAPGPGNASCRPAASGVTVRGLSWTGDRAAFIGPYRDPSRPLALDMAGHLDDAVGTGDAPCIAQQVIVDLEPAATVELAFLLGTAADDAAAEALLDRHHTLDAIDDAVRAARTAWRDLTTTLEIETPAPALDLLVNHWLPYQITSCRLRGRSAFYQSGGAFGFRDQLQDAAALVHARPEWTRAQILLHAAQQFPEGDVLHWWHPPHGAGIRTRFADDRLWLPYLTAGYVRATGDDRILDEPVRGIEARRLAPGEDEAYLRPEPSEEVVDLYERCCRALDCSLTRGAHGLPLIGTGDWNDGMNRVGREGRGESVWLGFFTHASLTGFLPICERRGDTDRVRRYREYRERLAEALDDAGWDGAWYRRAYYDDGTPLGSRTGDECRIDGLVQAWSVLSGVAPRPRAEAAMAAVEDHLVRDGEQLIRLLTPPFESTPHDPGYIKGYVRGVRENGGQYTHAALWMVQAMLELGQRERGARWLELLNPVLHARDAAQVAVYQVEPYVVAADVYGEPPHVGRGGWTWYTGAAGWMLRVVLESLLGLQLDGGAALILRPRVPDAWPAFTVRYRPPGTRTAYVIQARHPGPDAAAGVTRATLDGTPLPIEGGACRVPLAR